MNNSSPLISIIMPVFNAGSLLQRSIPSLLQQSYAHIEIICVNDGSADNSAALLDQYAEKHPSLRVIHQQNAGTGTARNAGLKAAAGDYIMFCDADDAYQPTMCEEMLSTLLKEQTDLVMCDCHILKTDNIQRVYMQDESNNYFRLKMSGHLHLSDHDRVGINAVLWNKIFKKSIIDQYQIAFPDGILNHEDACFVWQYLAVSQTLYGLNKALYDYYLSSGSLMTALYDNPDQGQPFDLFEALIYFSQFLQAHQLTTSCLNFYDMVLNNKLSWYLHLVSPATRLKALQKMHDDLLPVLDPRLTARNVYLQLIQQQNYDPFMTSVSTADAPSSAANTVSLTAFAEKLAALITEQSTHHQKAHALLMNYCVTMTEQLQGLKSPAENPVLYQNLTEITHLQTHFASFNRQDTGLIALLKGLDTQSTGTVMQILSQISQLNDALSQSAEGDAIDLFALQDMAEISEMKRMFEPYILHVSPDYHQYKQAILPVPQFSSLPFYFNYGLSCVRNTDSIKGKSVLDIGSRAGDSALVFQQLHPDAVYLFEDNPDQLRLIHQTIALNQLHNTHVITPDNTHAAADTIDAYTDAIQIKKTGLLKINVSAEVLSVLEGAVHTITRDHPVLIIHIDHHWSHFIRVKPFIDALQLGYQCHIYKPVNGSIIQDTLLIAE